MAGIYTGEKILEEKLQNAELETEEAIMNEKERFGRVRTSLMKQLRAKYGDDVANRALYRINKRISEGSLRIKANLNTMNSQHSEV
jgi:F0F1-type ATP synthase membrane subunit b/b'